MKATIEIPYHAKQEFIIELLNSNVQVFDTVTERDYLTKCNWVSISDSNYEKAYDIAQLLF